MGTYVAGRGTGYLWAGLLLFAIGAAVGVVFARFFVRRWGIESRASWIWVIVSSVSGVVAVHLTVDVLMPYGYPVVHSAFGWPIPLIGALFGVYSGIQWAVYRRRATSGDPSGSQPGEVE